MVLWIDKLRVSGLLFAVWDWILGFRGFEFECAFGHVFRGLPELGHQKASGGIECNWGVRQRQDKRQPLCRVAARCTRRGMKTGFKRDTGSPPALRVAALHLEP